MIDISTFMREKDMVSGLKEAHLKVWKNMDKNALREKRPRYFICGKRQIQATKIL